ncbi:SLBB domain-containing protein [Gammaproteobacteria bacterium]|nr:SLBB domain-containing protein [Gammaproteobacteria bacterium]
MKNIRLKTLFTTLIILINYSAGTSVYAQSSLSALDPDFINGIPPSIRDSLDYEEELREEEELEKLLSSKTSVRKNEALLIDLKKKLDLLEKSINSQSQVSSQNDSLDRFGSKFFKTIQSSFMPVNVPNFGGKYLIDVGDEFHLMLTGSIESEDNLLVSKDGSITIPKIGKVFVAGKTLNEVEKIVSQFISSSSFGTNSFLTLEKVRDVQVLLLGGLESPGIYTLSGGSSVLGAINVAGGIANNGSFRHIEIRRNGETIQVLDLYDVFVFGNYSFDYSMRSGDTIYVNPIKIQVPVSGGINLPAIYEALPGETAADLISYAGGFAESFSGFDYVYISKVGLESQNTEKLSLANLGSYAISPRQSIKVPSFINSVDSIKQVKIEGMVNRPGSYFISDGETLSDVIAKAGGYKKEAYVYGAALFRAAALEKEALYAQLTYADTITYIAANIGSSQAVVGPGALTIVAEELRSKNFTGRVVTEFNLNALRDEPKLDANLMHGDTIVIPSLSKTVYMFGDFKNSLNITYDPSRKISEYIELSGGLKESAYKEILIIDPDGKTHIFNGKSLFNSIARNSIQIYPGSIIYAPRDVGKLSTISYVATVSPILSSLALTLASLNTIK